MQFCSWEALADKLHFERKKASRPSHVLLETALNNHLSMKVCNEIKEVISGTGIQTISVTYTVKNHLRQHRQHQSQSGMWAKRLGLLVRWSTTVIQVTSVKCCSWHCSEVAMLLCCSTLSIDMNTLFNGVRYALCCFCVAM